MICIGIIILWVAVIRPIKINLNGSDGSEKEKPSEKEQDVWGELKSRISQLIIDGELSPDDGKAVLERVTGYSDFEINKAIRTAVEGQGDKDWNAYDELFSAIESGKNIQETIDKYRKIGYTDKSI